MKQKQAQSNSYSPVIETIISLVGLLAIASSLIWSATVPTLALYGGILCLVNPWVALYLRGYRFVQCLDKWGYPVVTIKGRWIQNGLRRAIHTRTVKVLIKKEIFMHQFVKDMPEVSEEQKSAGRMLAESQQKMCDAMGVPSHLLGKRD